MNDFIKDLLRTVEFGSDTIHYCFSRKQVMAMLDVIRNAEELQFKNKESYERLKTSIKRLKHIDNDEY